MKTKNEKQKMKIKNENHKLMLEGNKRKRVKKEIAFSLFYFVRRFLT